MVDDDTIEGLTRQIVEYCNPSTIFMFGSRARGDYRADSDVDLLVIWGGKPHLSHRQRSFMLRNAIGLVPYGLDIITYTPEELEEVLSDPKSFTSTIMKEAKQIYG